MGGSECWYHCIPLHCTSFTPPSSKISSTCASAQCWEQSLPRHQHPSANLLASVQSKWNWVNIPSGLNQTSVVCVFVSHHPLRIQPRFIPSQLSHETAEDMAFIWQSIRAVLDVLAQWSTLARGKGQPDCLADWHVTSPRQSTMNPKLRHKRKKWCCCIAK